MLLHVLPTSYTCTCFLFMGGKEKWGDFGAEPQHPGGFISGGTRPLSTTALPSHPLLQRLQLFGSMAFTGKYETESEKNYDEFMKRLGE